ncbi:MAG: VWA domain-containing protein [Candidatus Acidiferrales bacterium]
MRKRTILTLGLIPAIAAAGSIFVLGAPRGADQNASSPSATSAQSPQQQAPPSTSGQPPSQNSQAPGAQSPFNQAVQSQQPSQAIRATTRLVQVSVVVHDKHGNPISDLTKDDFVLLDEKKAQEIRLFSVETNQLPAHPPPALPPNTYTNRIQERGNVPTSITVILFDGLNTHITDQAYARQQVIKFIQKQIQPQDRVALYSLGHDLRILHDFTNDASSLLAALAAYQGRTTPELEASEPQQEMNPLASPAVAAFLNNAYQREANVYVTNRVHQTVEALTAIANHVGTLPGRKNLIWVSESFPFSIGYENLEMTTTDEREHYGAEVETAARALTNANLAVYPVDARGLMTFDLQNQSNSNNAMTRGSFSAINPGPVTGDPRMKGPNTSNFDTMNILAERTGGKAFYNRNDLWTSIREAIDDSRVTYELGYYPQGVTWDGSFREIKVEVKRSGARVRARKGYFALPEPKLTPQVRQAVIAQAGTSPLEPTGVGVTVRVQPVGAASEGKLRTIVYMDLHEFAFGLKDGRWNGSVDSVFIQLDSRNQIINAVDQTFHLNLEPPTFQRLLKEGTTYTKDIQIQSNAVELRVILRDGVTGTVGAVGVPLAKYFPVHLPTNN